MLFLLLACAHDVADGRPSPVAVPADAPMGGATLGSDQSDHDCNVVLREAAPDCDAGVCVIEGVLDVSVDIAEAGGWPVVLYTLDGVEWWEASAEPTGDDGVYTTYTFTLDSGASLPEIQLIPAVFTSPTERLFDHNRNVGAFENYTLSADNGWTVEDDDAVCQPEDRLPTATIVFDAGWTQAQHGAIQPGGRLVVDYDLYRLPGCMDSTAYGMPAWETLGYYRFLPDGEAAYATLRGDQALDGTWTSVPMTLDVPEDATGVELWFYTSGRTCSAEWDSNYGANYGFAVEEAPGPVGWAGDWGHALTRDCSRSDWIPEPIVVDSWIMSRAACTYVDAEVYVPGLTDKPGQRTDLVLAQVVYSKDGGVEQTGWLEHVGSDGNNWRYQWTLPRTDMMYSPWNVYTWRLRFSTDGVDWWTIAQDEGPAAALDRTIARDPSWCPETYWGPEWCG